MKFTRLCQVLFFYSFFSASFFFQLHFTHSNTDVYMIFATNTQHRARDDVTQSRIKNTGPWLGICWWCTDVASRCHHHFDPFLSTLIQGCRYSWVRLWWAFRIGEETLSSVVVWFTFHLLDLCFLFFSFLFFWSVVVYGLTLLRRWYWVRMYLLGPAR